MTHDELQPEKGVFGIGHFAPVEFRVGELLHPKGVCSERNCGVFGDAGPGPRGAIAQESHSIRD